MNEATARETSGTESHDSDAVIEAPEKHRRLTIFLSGIAFFVGYVLSAGPVVFIVRRFELPMVNAIVEFLYAPLILIVKLDVPLISSLIQSYVKLFE